MTIKRRKNTERESEKEYIKYPKLRAGIRPIAVQTPEGKNLIGLEDELELSEKIIYLSPELYYLLQYFDGYHSVDDIRHEYFRNYNTILVKDRYDYILQLLDEHYLLENQKYNLKIHEIKNAFLERPLRPAALADISYPRDPTILTKELNQYSDSFDIDHTLLNKIISRGVKAFIAPHIDLRLGGSVYTSVYSALKFAQHADLYVIFGVGHQGISNLFALTYKDFETPFGVIETEKQIVNSIIKKSDNNFLADEFQHKAEHSIEFQTLFLHHTIKKPFKILPVLCSFSHQMTKDSEQLKIFNDLLSSLKHALSGYAGKICYIASVDFAHVGPRYGHSKSPNHSDLALVEQNDKSILQAVAELNEREFQQIIGQSRNVYNICGYSALLTFINCIPPSKGHLLSYANPVIDEQTRSHVSFASMIFL